MKPITASIIGIVVVLGAVQLVSAQTVKSIDKAIAARIKPVGTVCVEGQPCAKQLSSNSSQSASSGSSASGKQTYTKVCSACHASGVAGAPKFGSYKDWGPRIAQGMKKLYNAAEHGYKAMPPKGTCASCTTAQLKSAVNYMVDAAKSNKGKG